VLSAGGDQGVRGGLSKLGFTEKGNWPRGGARTRVGTLAGVENQGNKRGVRGHRHNDFGGRGR